MPPSGGQRRQFHLKLVGLPVHEPGEPVSVLPTLVDPEIVGSDVFVGAEALLADPSPGRSSASTIAASATGGSPPRSARLDRTRLDSAVMVNLLRSRSPEIGWKSRKTPDRG
jgi:hypothetical protein